MKSSNFLSEQLTRTSQCLFFCNFQELKKLFNIFSLILFIHTQLYIKSVLEKTMDPAGEKNTDSELSLYYLHFIILYKCWKYTYSTTLKIFRFMIYDYCIANGRQSVVQGSADLTYYTFRAFQLKLSQKSKSIENSLLSFDTKIQRFKKRSNSIKLFIFFR